MTKSTQTRLLRAARSAAKNAFAPFSKLKVGAAVLTAQNRIFSGCNIENSSYGLTICAERVAVAKAMSAGERRIEAIAIFARPSRPRTAGRRARIPGLTPPCGACLQVINGFGNNPEIILSDGRRIETLHLRDLLPRGFQLRPR